MAESFNDLFYSVEPQNRNSRRGGSHSLEISGYYWLELYSYLRTYDTSIIVKPYPTMVNNLLPTSLYSFPQLLPLSSDNKDSSDTLLPVVKYNPPSQAWRVMIPITPSQHWMIISNPDTSKTINSASHKSYNQPRPYRSLYTEVPRNVRQRYK